jgi:hypothetical protein
MRRAAGLADALMDRGRLALLVATALVLLAVAFDVPRQMRGPAPYPPEWQWPLRGEPASGRWASPVLAAAFALGLLLLSDSGWARARPRGSARALLAGATLAGFAFSVGLLGLEPAGSFATLAARAMSPSWSSYYSVAVSPEAADPLEFLDRHDELLARLPKHAATHPPGPVLYYRGLVALFERSPLLTRAFLALQGHDEGRDPRPPNTRASKAAALFGALLLTLLGMAAAWPVAAIAARVSGDALSGARAGVLWTLLPGPVLFVPQFDQALAVAIAGTTALLLTAVLDTRAPVRVALAIAAGLLAGLALFTSYGSVVFLAFVGVTVLVVAGFSRSLLSAGLVAAAVAIAFVGLTPLLGHDPIGAFRTALSIHHETYTRPRSYLLWVPFDLLDLAIFLGPPVAALFVREVERSLLARALAVALAVLVLSGATRGEVGRIWIPLMPLLLVAAVARPSSAGEPARPSPADALWVGALLAVLDVALRIRWQL